MRIKLKCVDNKGVAGRITLNEIYFSSYYENGNYVITDDNGVLMCVSIDRFVVEC